MRSGQVAAGCTGLGAALRVTAGLRTCFLKSPLDLAPGCTCAQVQWTARARPHFQTVGFGGKDARMWIILAALAGASLVITVLVDAFETILLPRTITRGFRLTRVFYRATWQPWSALGSRLPAGSFRENFLSFFGPLSILLLTGCWAVGLVFGFGLLQWALTPEKHGWGDLGNGIYLSGNLFFTLGLGDVNPYTPFTRILAVTEAGLGFAFLASIISYLPVIYAGFSRRELLVLRMDVRAGSPPSAGELLRQHGHRGDERDLDGLLRDCELWAAEMLESQLSYPVLCMYRSQHRDQSWLAALTTVLDTCALLVVGVQGIESKQAPMTFAMCRRVIIDLAHVFRQVNPDKQDRPDRLPPNELSRLRALLERDASLQPGNAANEKLNRLRATYEPAAHGLSEFLLMPLPPWMPSAESGDRPTSAAEMFFEEEGATDVSVL